jgi:hypothetical protein
MANSSVTVPSADLRIALPEPSSAAADRQDQEWCVVYIAGAWRELRFHDYPRIFEIQGLYERLFHDVLRCASPHVVRDLLRSTLAEARVPPKTLRVLDLGAGNGIVGQELRDLGVGSLTGVDIHDEAAQAAERDRPGVYDDYHTVDLTNLSLAQRRRLNGHGLNALCCVAALGFDDVPPAAFCAAYNLLPVEGWIAFTLKEEFLSDDSDDSGFATLVKEGVDRGALDLRATCRYQHRLSSSLKPIYYRALIGTKKSDL